MNEALLVFVSQSSALQAQQPALIGALCESLRSCGVEPLFETDIVGPVAEGWSLWMLEQWAQPDWVLVVCAPARDGAADRFGEIIPQEILDAEDDLRRFIPLILEPDHVDSIPAPLRSNRRFCLAERDALEQICAWLRD